MFTRRSLFSPSYFVHMRKIKMQSPVIVFHMCEIKMQGLMRKIKLQGYKRGQIECRKRKHGTAQEPYVQEKEKAVQYRIIRNHGGTSHGEPNLHGTLPGHVATTVICPSDRSPALSWA
jgi:hypothetical protein